ncbi:MAG: hypothetical protein U9O96_05330 [Candidatus Thermoplasmatota archaeon]|nr:hypothetical protein [Candidatus Thermoplasmatota archaeon]
MIILEWSCFSPATERGIPLTDSIEGMYVLEAIASVDTTTKYGMQKSVEASFTFQYLFISEKVYLSIKCQKSKN